MCGGGTLDFGKRKELAMQPMYNELGCIIDTADTEKGLNF